MLMLMLLSIPGIGADALRGWQRGLSVEGKSPAIPALGGGETPTVRSSPLMIGTVLRSARKSLPSRGKKSLKRLFYEK